jgi:hypothetical protein
VDPNLEIRDKYLMTSRYSGLSLHCVLRDGVSINVDNVLYHAVRFFNLSTTNRNYKCAVKVS